MLTKHLLDDNVEGAESALTERAVYDRDIAWLEACDVLIADGSGSSFGVGFEVGYVLGRSDRTDQRVVLLYRADRRDRISRLIVGNAHPRCRVIPYTAAAELVAAVNSAIEDRGLKTDDRCGVGPPTILGPRTSILVYFAACSWPATASTGCFTVFRRFSQSCRFSM